MAALHEKAMTGNGAAAESPSRQLRFNTTGLWCLPWNFCTHQPWAFVCVRPVDQEKIKYLFHKFQANSKRASAGVSFFVISVIAGITVFTVNLFRCHLWLSLPGACLPLVGFELTKPLQPDSAIQKHQLQVLHHPQLQNQKNL